VAFLYMDVSALSNASRVVGSMLDNEMASSMYGPVDGGVGITDAYWCDGSEIITSSFSV
jgi:hypothetical protein